MSASYVPYQPDQQYLMPCALQEWLPQVHLAYFINDTVERLDGFVALAADDRASGWDEWRSLRQDGFVLPTRKTGRQTTTCCSPSA